MPIDIDRALTETEDFLRRQLGSRAAREAQKRKVQRGVREVLRRVRRSALLFVALLAALTLYSIFVAPIGFFTWLVAIPTVFLAALVALFWPSRRREAPANEPVTAARLESAAAETEEWLLARCNELPRAALRPVDAILTNLAELQPNLAALPRDTPLEGETRRLICQHLPRLVDTYLSLPPSARAPNSENSKRLTESLGIVADELERLSGEISRDGHLSFDTQHRFIETRYKDRDLYS
ncbi:MAG TPA: hypothetical protein VK391_06355 [Allosphingosinicella sp.]|nr:hypothetical protein [Allosphingosinicella sp.]